MEKDLDKLFNNLKGSFDTNAPQDGHTERFLEKLDASAASIDATNPRVSIIPSAVCPAAIGLNSYLIIRIKK